MQQLITVLHIFVSILLVILVLIQRGKGADMGTGFGGGASGTVFGSQGVTPFLVKLTTALAIFFFVSSALLSFVIGRHNAATSGELPFLAEPVKTEQLIPVSSEVQEPLPLAVPATVAPKPTLPKATAPSKPTTTKPVVKKESSKKEAVKKPVKKNPTQPSSLHQPSSSG